jgi:hypothetical protein
VLLITKYDFEFLTRDIEVNVRRLTNQLWKLIPMREHEEDWSKQLETVTLEIAGLNEIFMNPQFLQLLSKLEGLRTQETNFELYRKTVFESISLLQELNRGIRL